MCMLRRDALGVNRRGAGSAEDTQKYPCETLRTPRPCGKKGV